MGVRNSLYILQDKTIKIFQVLKLICAYIDHIQIIGKVYWRVNLDQLELVTVKIN